jgi:hypothetical protein
VRLPLAVRLDRGGVFRGDAPDDFVDLLAIAHRLGGIDQLSASVFVAHLLLDHLLRQKGLHMLRFLLSGPLLLLLAIAAKATLLLFDSLLFVSLTPHGHLATLIVARLSDEGELEFAFQFPVLVVVLSKNAASLLVASLGGDLFVQGIRDGVFLLDVAAAQLFGAPLGVNALHYFELLISNPLTRELLPHDRAGISLVMTSVHRLGLDLLLVVVVEHLVGRPLLVVALVYVASHPLCHWRIYVTYGPLNSTKLYKKFFMDQLKTRPNPLAVRGWKSS